jgi:hypothetical protein
LVDLINNRYLPNSWLQFLHSTSFRCVNAIETMTEANHLETRNERKDK